MRYFIVIGHKAITSPEFSLEDLPGTSGRLDILCRCINAAFMLSHGIRRNVQIFLVLCGGDPQKILLLKGEDLRHLNPDERTTAALLKKALAIADTPEWTRSTPGIFVRRGGLADLLHHINSNRFIYLKEDGIDIRNITQEKIFEDPVFILGDHQGLTKQEEILIEQNEAKAVSIGPSSLHADHCIVLINWMLDTGLIGYSQLWHGPYNSLIDVAGDK